MGVYIIHFLTPYKHAAHYTGFSPEVQARVNAHLHGKGARLTEVVHEAGIQMVLVRVWEEADRKFERRIKNDHVKKYCPICQGQGVQLPLLCGEAAYVPAPADDEIASAQTCPIDDTQLNFDDFNIVLRGQELADYIDEQDRAWFAAQGIDVASELADLQEGMADIDFWGSGHW